MSAPDHDGDDTHLVGDPLTREQQARVELVRIAVDMLSSHTSVGGLKTEVKAPTRTEVEALAAYLERGPQPDPLPSGWSSEDLAEIIRKGVAGAASRVTEGVPYTVPKPGPDGSVRWLSGAEAAAQAVAEQDELTRLHERDRLLWGFHMVPCRDVGPGQSQVCVLWSGHSEGSGGVRHHIDSWGATWGAEAVTEQDTEDGTLTYWQGLVADLERRLKALQGQADVHRSAADDSQRLFRRMYGTEGQPCLSDKGDGEPCVQRKGHPTGYHRDRNGLAWPV